MRSPTRILVPAVLAAGLALTGCSEEVEGTATPASTASSTSSSSSPSSTASSPSGGGEYEEFCTEGEQAFEEVDDAFDAAEAGGVDEYVTALQAAVDAFDAVEPPDEIAEDWQEARDGYVDLRDDVAAIDRTAPDADDQAVALVAQAEAALGPTIQRVGGWIEENCPDD